MKNTIRAALLLSVLASLGSQAQAIDPPRRDLLSFSVNASTEVTRDVISLAFSTTREGSDPNQVQAQLKAALDAALTEARKIAKPGQVDVQTGNFSLFPRYSIKGGINGWQGQAELLVEGKDTAAIAALSGRITSMSIARSGFLLSREAREKAERQVSGEAIQRFRAQAADYAKQFGYAGYVIGEVSVNTSEAVQAMPMMRAKTLAMAEESLPIESGRATVSVSVSGSVLMNLVNK
ncbi:SIMPL domain-containing protein [Pelomonas sp. SE-A7]|uniref:SIMPL domain-containing protein n=1 Tax=Pelomonas sp. SE-A7 TaxID=3054953 RepID=UPI00259CDD27|nr:SIMPL domain-containing protein [Pelomonas sp. SE-A7]MDM4765782.1 SIMPL domain-containing protein [Pelomonas sp. SE-A7]